MITVEHPPPLGKSLPDSTDDEDGDDDDDDEFTYSCTSRIVALIVLRKVLAFQFPCHLRLKQNLLFLSA